MYKESYSRAEFDARTSALILQARKAQNDVVDYAVREMVFQCAILQTSAAMESYIRLVVESLIFNARKFGMLGLMPSITKALMVSRKIEQHFSNYSFHKEENRLLTAISHEAGAFNLMNPACSDWKLFDASVIYHETAYPSIKNLKKLLSRLGVDNFVHLANKKMKGDYEVLIDNFQSIRTALAHESPPNVTLQDVVDRISDMQKAIHVLDEVLYEHIAQLGGAPFWA